MVKKSEKELTVKITSGTIIKTILILAVFYFLYLFINLVLVILTAVVIASAIEPATKWFEKYRIPRVPAVIMVYGLIISAFIGVSCVFVQPLVEDIISIDSTYNISTTVSEYVGTNDDEGAMALDFSFQGILQDIRDALSGTPEQAFQTISSIFGGLLGFVLVIVFSFYFAVQENGISNFLCIITPNKHEKYVIDLWKRTQKKIGLWMQGQLILGLIVGVLVYLGLALMQVPYAMTLALIAAMFEVIPIFGPVLAAVPAVLFGSIHGIYLIGFIEPGLTAGVIVVLFYVIIQQFENHLIYPLVVRKVIGVPPLLVIIAMVVGAQAAGFLGIILAVPMAAALMEFTNDIQKEKSLAKTKK
ncbi:MAG: AI-2E family transporter [Candidatus Pacebacteria bacterium]|nr:AI-2E family transporter [Candidatus Paceibacterota bacterium]